MRQTAKHTAPYWLPLLLPRIPVRPSYSAQPHETDDPDLVGASHAHPRLSLLRYATTALAAVSLLFDCSSLSEAMRTSGLAVVEAPVQFQLATDCAEVSNSWKRSSDSVLSHPHCFVNPDAMLWAAVCLAIPCPSRQLGLKLAHSQSSVFLVSVATSCRQTAGVTRISYFPVRLPLHRGRLLQPQELYPTLRQTGCESLANSWRSMSR